MIPFEQFHQELHEADIVITGGAGFIGSHVMETLLEGGAQAIAVDDLSTCGREKIVHLEGRDGFSLVVADVRDEEAMTEALKGSDIVMHLATRNVRLSLTRPTEVHEVNVIGTFNVLKAAKRAGAKRFLYCSSSEVNGTAREVPMKEEYRCEPETIYGASKLAGEYYSSVFQRSGWLETVIARPHNTYGPREHADSHYGEVIPRFVLLALSGKPLTIYGDGSQTRDFTYVTETAHYLIELAIHDKTAGGTYNVCRGRETSILALAEMICSLTGLNESSVLLPARPADVLRLWGDPTHLRDTLGSGPSISIEEGLERTVAWFRHHMPEGVNSLAKPYDVAEQSLSNEDWL